MFVTLALTASVACSHGLSIADAKRLVLASPNIRAAVAERHARPFFEYVETHRGGWQFGVKARNPCRRGPGTCSNLLGHYSVSRTTGEVEDLDAGEEGRVISTRELEALRHRLMVGHCG